MPLFSFFFGVGGMMGVGRGGVLMLLLWLLTNKYTYVVSTHPRKTKRRRGDMGGYNTNRQQQKPYTRMQMDGSSLKKQQQKTEKHPTGYSMNTCGYQQDGERKL